MKKIKYDEDCKHDCDVTKQCKYCDDHCEWGNWKGKCKTECESCFKCRQPCVERFADTSVSNPIWVGSRMLADA